VVEIYQTPDPALTVYVVFFLNKPDRGTSLILNIVMVVLISLIITSVILVAIIVIDEPVWRVASMAAISLGLLFMASASKLRPIGGIVALIVAYALDLLGTVHGGEIATRGLLYVWLFIGIPAGVSMGVNLLLAPSPRLVAEKVLARRLRLAATMLRAPNEGIRRDLTECLREGNGELLKWLKLALVEKSAAREHVEALRQAAASSFEILALIDVMDRDIEAVRDLARFTIDRQRRPRLLYEGVLAAAAIVGLFVGWPRMLAAGTRLGGPAKAIAGRMLCTNCRSRCFPRRFFRPINCPGQITSAIMSADIWRRLASARPISAAFIGY
jgi:hypothetical protein